MPRAFRGGPAGIGSVDAAEAFPADTVLVGGFDMAGTTLTHYLNGLPIGSGEITAAAADAGRPLRIGTRDDLVTRMKGDIAELVIYSRALSEAERNQVVDYLKSKYGLGVFRPALTISRAPNNSVLIAWPSSAADFLLESSAAITGGWTKITPTIVPQGDQNTATLPLGAGNLFIRLTKP